jgi:hypothetical protein
LAQTNEKRAYNQNRHKIYFAAVHAIDAREHRQYWLDQTVSYELKRKFSPLRSELWPYQPFTFNRLVQKLRQKCPNMRAVKFGRGQFGWSENIRSGRDDSYGYCTEWTAHLDRDASSDPSCNIVEFQRIARHYLDSAPPTYIECPHAPSAHYSARLRFDLELNSASGTPLTEDWLKSLRNDTLWADLYTQISVDELPITLDDLGTLYQRQIAAGHSTRLQDIQATGVEPWSAYQFEGFASIASASLVSLNFVSILGREYHLRPSAISFADLPSLSRSIRTHLPNLKKLQLFVKHIDTAEDVCKGALRSTMLGAHGSLTSLRIYSEKPTRSVPLFNTLRSLIGLMVADGNIVVEYDGAHPDHVYSPQRKFVQYLRGLVDSSSCLGLMTG